MRSKLCNMPCILLTNVQALRLALLALDGGITLEPFSDYVVLSLEVGCCAMLCCRALLCHAALWHHARRAAAEPFLLGS